MEVGAHGANKAFRESLRTLIDAISSDASKLHTFLAAVFSNHNPAKKKLRVIVHEKKKKVLRLIKL